MKKIINKAVLFFLCASLLVTSALFVGCDKQDEKKGREYISTALYGQTVANNTRLNGFLVRALLPEDTRPRDLTIIVTEEGVFSVYENNTVVVPAFTVGKFVGKDVWKSEISDITQTTYTFEVNYVDEVGALKTFNILILDGTTSSDDIIEIVD